MSKSKIEWTDAVWNPVTGCSKVSAGCTNCYAERMSKRLAGRCGYLKDEPFKVTLHPDKLEDPLKWKKSRKIFVNSMSDLFHEDVPDEFIFKVFNTMANASWINGHIFLVLTKRPERMKSIIESIRDDLAEQAKPVKLQDGRTQHKMTFPFPLRNIWLGVSVENQVAANERIPLLLQTPAAVRFISAEPLLSEINISRYLKWPVCKHWNADGNPYDYGKYRWEKQSFVGAGWTGLDWVITGGESGPGARPMHPDWVRSLRDQCQAAGTKFFFKQWGEWVNEYPQGHNLARRAQAYRHGESFYRVGKKEAGRQLDGRTWDEIPELRQGP